MYDRVIWPEKYDPKCRPSVRSNENGQREVA